VATALLLAFVLGSLVCWIIVLVKLFINGYTIQCLLGLLCGVVAFIYGWSKADDIDVRPIMYAWTGCIVGWVVMVFRVASDGVPVR
jgi:hypothetical protein